MRDAPRHLRPPRTERSTLPLNRLWSTLPEPDRRRLLQILGRLVAQQLRPRPAKGAPDERN